jgi:resuscitation-promoting factor RpfB
MAVLLLVLGANAACGPVNRQPLAAGGAFPTEGASSAAASTGPEQVVGNPTAAPTTAGPAPVVEKKRITETQTIPFSTRNVNDPSLAKGTKKVRTKGVAGSKTITYDVTYSDGVETARTVVSSKVIKQPVTQVVAVGTKTSNCDPNYTGCVPIASDVDCAGGSGDGPAYVQGPIRVIGTDIYGLDRDGDGIACE